MNSKATILGEKSMRKQCYMKEAPKLALVSKHNHKEAF